MKEVWSKSSTYSVYPILGFLSLLVKMMIIYNKVSIGYYDHSLHKYVEPRNLVANAVK